MGKDVRVFESREELSKGLAEYIGEVSDACVREKGAFSVAFSGGNLSQLLWELCKPNSPYLKTVDWPKWHVCWAVENVVPKTHPDNISKQTKEALLSKLPIPFGNIYSVSHLESAETAAENYEYKIRQLVRYRKVEVFPSSDCPRFDLILLVLGDDGQIASLLPNHKIIEEESAWVAPVEETLTFTFPVINSAANVVIIATGSSVAGAFASALGSPVSRGANPAQLVKPKQGNLVWFADGSAASGLGGDATLDI